MVKRCPTCGYNNRDDAIFCSSCGTSLAAPGAPTLKPVPSVRVVTPVTPGVPIRVPPPGMCFYHPNLPAVYVCNRCGRPICRDDARAYMDLVLCPQCYTMILPPAPGIPGYPPGYPAPAAPPPVPGPPLAPGIAPPIVAAPVRALWGFMLSVIAGILILLNSAALLNPGFYATWRGIFFWLPAVFDPIYFAIGAISGLIVIVGSILMILGYGTIGSVVVFPLAVLSLIIGGGFVAGFVLGIVGGILGMLGR